MTTGGEIRYARSGGVDIAYQTFGDPSADRDIIYVPGFVSHLDLMWEMPPYAAILRRLTDVGRVTVFDKRGTGLSTRSGFGSLADRTDDIRVVMNAAGIERADFFGISEGGPLSMVFTATYPDRVSSLCLFGTLVRGTWAPDFPAGPSAEAAEGFISWVESRWGTGEPFAAFTERLSRSEELRRFFARYERSACTPAQAGEILRSNSRIDVRHLLPTINVPCLVLHMKGDPLCSVGQARYVAKHVPRAELLEHEGDFHIPWGGEAMDWALSAAERFFGKAAAEPDPLSPPSTRDSRGANRTLATVLFTDIVGSTERAAATGDDAWSRQLDEHDDLSARTVRFYRGRLVKTTGDGMLAVFDSPSRAVECARRLSGELAEMGIPVRAGLHTGEVELRGDDIGGVGVHLASRVNALAGSGEVWVSRTVRDLVSGSGIQLEPRGAHSLKGFDEAWELYAVAG